MLSKFSAFCIIATLAILNLFACGPVVTNAGPCAVADAAVADAPPVDAAVADAPAPAFAEGSRQGEWVHLIPGSTNLGSAVVTIANGRVDLWPGCVADIAAQSATRILLRPGTVCLDYRAAPFTIRYGALYLTDGFADGVVEGESMEYARENVRQNDPFVIRFAEARGDR